MLSLTFIHTYSTAEVDSTNAGGKQHSPAHLIPPLAAAGHDGTSVKCASGVALGRRILRGW